MILNDAILQPQSERLAAIERAWENLTGPGPLLSAHQRLGVIEVARAAWAGSTMPNSVRDLTHEAAHWVAMDAGGLTGETVDEFEARGLDRLTYLEVVGVVARLANVDFYARGIGASLPNAPAGTDQAPTGEINPEAGITDSWVPMLSAALAPFVLDALPSEGEALRDLHGPMYLSMEAFGDFGHVDELTRVQTEWVAARTAYLNECFY